MNPLDEHHILGNLVVNRPRWGIKRQLGVRGGVEEFQRGSEGLDGHVYGVLWMGNRSPRISELYSCFSSPKHQLRVARVMAMAAMRREARQMIKKYTAQLRQPRPPSMASSVHGQPRRPVHVINDAIQDSKGGS